MKNRLTKVLIIITFLLWGFIFYSIAEVIWFRKNEKSNILEDKQKIITNYLSVKKFQYEKLGSDPFRLKFVKEDTVHYPTFDLKESTPKVQLKEELVPFELAGVVIGNNRHIIIKDKLNSEILFLKEKERFKDLEISEILKNKVILKNQFSKKIDTLFVR